MTSFFDQYKSHIDIENINIALAEAKKKFSLPIYQKYHETLKKTALLNQFTIPQEQSTSFNLQGPSELDLKVEELAKELTPWRKGPYQINELFIDSEWRSDLKWDRIKASLGSLENRKILDVGCSNGYFMFKMLEQNPKAVLGIDPVAHCWAQFEFINSLLKEKTAAEFAPLGVEHVKYFDQLFDVILHMGIIYHHRHPLEQLLDAKKALRPGGKIILETITIPGEESICLFPEDRYAKMRNVWFVPTASCLVNWLHKTKFTNIQIISETKLTPEEQRVTKWSSQQSLEDFLDPNDPRKTIEGHPAPNRVAVYAEKKK